MKIVRRFDLEIEPEQTVNIPFNSEILGFGMHGKTPAIWALVDPEQRQLLRTIVFVSEEKDLPVNLNRHQYLGRFEVKAEVGMATVHAFEK